MGVRLAFDCEICGVEKRDVNHWYEVYNNGEGAIGIRHFQGNEFLKQVCGAACAHKLLDRWLSTGSLEKAEVVHPEEA